MSRGTTSGGDGGRYDGQAVILGVAVTAILFAFAMSICIYGYIFFQRYERDRIERRKFVNNNIPSKTYKKHRRKTKGAGRSSGHDSKQQEVQETALAMVSENDPEDDGVCSICLMPFKRKDKISWSTNEHCKHTFHKRCITEWLYKHTECPMCREVFLWVKKGDNSIQEDGVMSIHALEIDNAGSADAPNTAVDVKEDEEENIA